MSFNERVEQLNSSLDNQIDLKKLKVLKEAINKRMQSLTIVIDEAHVLATQFVDHYKVVKDNVFVLPY